MLHCCPWMRPRPEDAPAAATTDGLPDRQTDTTGGERGAHRQGGLEWRDDGTDGIGSRGGARVARFQRRASGLKVDGICTHTQTETGRDQ